MKVFFENLRTAQKLMLGFGLCLLFTCIIATTAIVNLTGMSTDIESVGMHVMPYTVKMARFDSAMKQVRLIQYRYIIVPKDRADSEQKWAQFLGAADKALAAYEATVKTDDERKVFEQIKTTWNDYCQTTEQIKPLVAADKEKEAIAFITNAGRDAFIKLRDLMDASIGNSEKKSQAIVQQSANNVRAARTWLIFNACLALVVGVQSAFWITRSIARPLAQVTQMAERLAVGDIAQQVTVAQRRDEIGQMAAAFEGLIAYQREMATIAEAVATGDLTQAVSPKSEADRLGHAFVGMVNQLSDLIGDVASNAEVLASTIVQLSQATESTEHSVKDIANTIREVAEAADQSAMTSQEIAQGSEQQAHAASEAAASMERLHAAIAQVQSVGQKQKQAAEAASTGMEQTTQSVKAVSQSTQQMASAAQQASQVAQSGGQAVQDTVASMGRIQQQVAVSAVKITELGEKGQEIGAIVESINQIAEQTNLLALNAAIEAARAGEHGKGFAVVADEVRKLAERATSATKEISALIGSVRSGVEEAVAAMEATNVEVKTGADKSKQAGTALTHILQSAQAVATEVESVAAIMEQMSASVQSVRTSVLTTREGAEETERAVGAMAGESQQVSASIHSVASVSQETAAGAEQMSASAQQVSASAQNVSLAVAEQTSSVGEVANAAQEMRTMAAQLQSLVSTFRLKEAAATPKSPARPSLRKAA